MTKRYPYILDDYGFLSKCRENPYNTNVVYLSDDEFYKLKGLSNSLSEKLHLLEKKKELELLRMKLIINKIKNEEL